MAINVDFYLLKSANSALFACRLAEKAYLNGNKVCIYTASKEAAAAINDQLWTFRDISFVPHGIDSEAPVVISYQDTAPNNPEVLINLTQNVPQFYDKFNRILEIVPDDAAVKTMARKKYKEYQNRNCKLQTHEIN